MAITREVFQRFDPADHLNDLADVTDHLQIALHASREDPTAVPRALGVIARSRNMSELARTVGMSRDGLCRALSENGNPRWSTVIKVTQALGLRFELHPVAQPAPRSEHSPDARSEGGWVVTTTRGSAAPASSSSSSRTRRAGFTKGSPPRCTCERRP